MKGMFVLPRLVRYFFAGGAAALFLFLGATIAQAATHSITITPTGFIPSTLRVNQGDTLEFRNSTTATQSARSSLATGFNTGDIGANQAKSVVVTNSGVFSYSSSHDASLIGSIEVVASTPSANTLTSTTSTTTATTAALTSQPLQTQPQPVSGVFEVVVGMTLVGLFMIGGGIFWQSYSFAGAQAHKNQEQIVSLPTLTWKDENTPPHQT